MSEETFGKVLKQARLSLGLSQMGLARKLGVRASHIDYLEQGRQRPSLTLLNALGDELGVDKERLFLLTRIKRPDQGHRHKTGCFKQAQRVAGVAC
jgi:putative transcriptional regulator